MLKMCSMHFVGFQNFVANQKQQTTARDFTAVTAVFFAQCVVNVSVLYTMKRIWFTVVPPQMLWKVKLGLFFCSENSNASTKIFVTQCNTVHV